jgi:tRNA(adenine34) deaminase
MMNCSQNSVEKKEEDIHFMRLALEEAGFAFSEGEVPVGALVVINGAVMAKAHNLRERLHDPVAHAEIIAQREAAHLTNNWRLTDATLYVTKEPCIMCAGAMVNARLGRLVYGCNDSKGGGVNSLYTLLTDKRLNHQVEVVSGVLEEECVLLLKRFFEERR